MAKQSSPREPDSEPEAGQLPTPANAPKENVNVDPLDPPPPEDEETATGDARQGQ